VLLVAVVLPLLPEFIVPLVVAVAVVLLILLLLLPAVVLRLPTAPL
jgi:hypothetical protein